MKYICSICGYVYDETAEGTAFAALPDSWVCPLCRAAKDLFRPEKIEAAPEPARPDPAAAGPSAHVDTDPPCARIWPGDARNSTKMKKPVYFARLPLTSRRLHRTSLMGISLIFSLCLRMI